MLQQLTRAIKNVGAQRAHYAFGRFELVRSLYSHWRKLRSPNSRNESTADESVDEDSRTLFPDVNVNRAVADLRRDAVALGFDLPPSIVQEITEYAESESLQPRGGGMTFRISDIRDGRLGNGTRILLADVIDAERCTAVSRLVRDRQLLNVATGHLGYRPERSDVRLYYSFVHDFSAAERKQLGQTVDYHFDVYGLNFLYANFYITSCDRTSGAHALIKGSHRGKPLWMLFSSANQPDSAVLKYFGPQNEYVVEGPSGTGFLEDASCYHKAIAPARSHRLFLQIRYS